MERAAEGGDLDLMRWIHAHGCPWDDSVLFYALLHGHLDLCRWARSHGCSWDASSMEGALAGVAERGQLDLLKYARQDGFPWNTELYVNSALEGAKTVYGKGGVRDGGDDGDAQRADRAALIHQLDVVHWCLAQVNTPSAARGDIGSHPRGMCIRMDIPPARRRAQAMATLLKLTMAVDADLEMREAALTTRREKLLAQVKRDVAPLENAVAERKGQIEAELRGKYHM